MNIVTATFSAGCTQIDADRKLWQYDQGQILQLVGLDLPDAYQVEFSNSRDKGSAKAQIGGPDGVQIPDEYLTTGKPVYAFLVGHTAEEDRETEKLVVIYVNARSQPTDEPITPEQQNIVDQLIAALTAGVAKAEDAAAQAEEAIGYMPKIVDGTWWVYDAETETWADTGIQAEGQDGVGISGAVLNADYTLTLTFTDGSSYTTPPIRGPKGEDAPDDYILVQPTEPTSETNALWINSAAGERVQLPTMADHQALVEAVADNTEAIGDLSDELAGQKSAIENLQALTNRKAGMLVDSASGSIASFVPDATVPNLLGVSVDIEPVQDLHGFDHPWPGGGGKNKFDVDNPSIVAGYIGTSSFSTGNDRAKTVYIPISPNTTYTVSKLAGQRFCIATAPTAPADNAPFSVRNANNTASSLTITSGANDAFLWAWVYLQDTDTVSLDTMLASLQIELGSTATAWTPYSNECPISGWDSVEVEAAGENLWGGSAFLKLADNWANAVVDTDAMTLTGRIQDLTTRANVFEFPFKKNTKYTIFVNASVANTGLYVVYADGTEASIATTRFVSNPSKTLAYLRFYISTSSAITFYANGIGVFEGDVSADAFKSYAGNRYTIALGQTVYGGTLDVTAGTLTVDRAILTVDGTTPIYGPPTRAYITLNTMERLVDYRQHLLCDKIPITKDANAPLSTLAIAGQPQDSSFPGQNWLYFLSPAGMFPTLDDLKAWIATNPLQVVYPLATPIVIQLDPVTISTISGQTNNVWADAGDVSVEFAADLKHYIDSKIAAAVAALS